MRSALSMVSTTSAWLRAGRVPEPAKITSSMPPARMALAEVAPMTQRSASSRLDLPQPLGPTMPVRPGLDAELGRLDEGLEAREAKPLELHGRRRPPLRGAGGGDRLVELASVSSPSSVLPLMTKVGVESMSSLSVALHPVVQRLERRSSVMQA